MLHIGGFFGAKGNIQAILEVNLGGTKFHDAFEQKIWITIYLNECIQKISVVFVFGYFQCLKKVLILTNLLTFDAINGSLRLGISQSCTPLSAIGMCYIQKIDLLS